MEEKANYLKSEEKKSCLARLLYAGFPKSLQEAMKEAAKRWGWDAATWELQTTLVHEAGLRGMTDEELSTAYAASPSPQTLQKTPFSPSNDQVAM